MVHVGLKSGSWRTRADLEVCPTNSAAFPILEKPRGITSPRYPRRLRQIILVRSRKTSLPSDNAIGAQTSCPARTCALAISLYAVVLDSISRSLPLLPSSARNMLSASMKLPRPNEAFPSLVQTSLPSKSRQVNRPRFFLPTANRWPLCTIGVCTSEFHSLFFRSNRHSVFKAPPSRRLQVEQALRLEGAAVAPHANHDAARVVAGGHEDPFPVYRDGRRCHRHVELAPEFPQQLAVAGRYTQRALERSIQILPDSTQHRRHHRGVRHQVLAGVRRAPDLCAGGLVERYQNGGAAGGDDDPAAFLERTLPVVPGGDGGLVFGDQALTPDLFAGPGVHAVEHGFGVQGADEPAVYRRYSAGYGVIRTNFARLAELPDQLAAVERAAVDRPLGLGLVVVVVIDPAGHDRGAGIALGHGDRPEELRSGCRPFA